MRLAERATASLLDGLAGARCVRKPGIAYAPGARGKLDLYRPHRPASGGAIVVFLYGGTWQSGDRAFYRFVGSALAGRGITAAIPDYRVYPEARWPDFLRDCAAAVAFVKRAAIGWGADPRRLFVIGHSAGAYNAAMLALDRRWLETEGLEPGAHVAGVVGLAGPYDFLPLRDTRLQVIFGPEDQRSQTQPMSHVNAAAPPMLLLVGGKDTVIRPGNTVRLSRAIVAAGGLASHRIYSDLGHVGILTALLAPLRRRAPVLNDIAAFVAAPRSPA
jgi:acetyl esterase/lipase